MRKDLEKSYLALTEFLLLSKRNLNEVAEKNGVTAIQALTLLLLYEDRPMHGFTKIFNCDASNITGIVDGLERKHLVERYESISDRRVKMIKIRSKGNKIRKAIISTLTSDNSYIVKKLSQTELATFIELLNKIAS